MGWKSFSFLFLVLFLAVSSRLDRRPEVAGYPGDAASWVARALRARGIGCSGTRQGFARPRLRVKKRKGREPGPSSLLPSRPSILTGDRRERREQAPDLCVSPRPPVPTRIVAEAVRLWPSAAEAERTRK